MKHSSICRPFLWPSYWTRGLNQRPTPGFPVMTTRERSQMRAQTHFQRSNPLHVKRSFPPGRLKEKKMAEIVKNIPEKTAPEPAPVDGFAEGFARGFAEGKEEGEKEGCARGEKALADTRDALCQILASLKQAQEEARLALRAEIAGMVIPLVSPLFMELAHNPDWLNVRIDNLLSHLNREETLRLHLHPLDIQRLQENGALKALPPKVEVCADERLRLGGCRLHSEHGTFDAGIEEQVERLKVLLLKRQEEMRHD
ncbi:hypothetical protein E4T54_07755 [Legionella geestiana]|nr:hypothetical protein E4T54_07755 [Legionella geestiana]